MLAEATFTTSPDGRRLRGIRSLRRILKTRGWCHCRGDQNWRSRTGPTRVAGQCSVSFVAVNAEQAEAWNGASGRHFIEQRERHERMRGAMTARLLACAQIQDRENVLDIGCGCGDATILAARSTCSGNALGADLSQIQVAEARRLAASAGVTNARFEVADAQVHPFQARTFDLVLSNFGVMFFDDPAAAFGNLRKALRRGGRLAFLCWRSRDENPFFMIGFAEAAAALNYSQLPGLPAAFSLADTSRVGALLSGAGFGGIEFAKVDEPMLVGRDVDDVLEYKRASPSAAGLLTGLSASQAAVLTKQVRDGLAAYASPGGVVMPGAVWLVTAQAV
jgi:SAM-dependent methyltransferase